MFAVRVPEEIRKYKEKLFFGLNARQLLSVAVASAISIPLYMYGRNYIQEDILQMAVVFITIIIGAVGFITIQGMPLEKYGIAVFKTIFLMPNRRCYKGNNVFSELEYKEEARAMKGISKRKLKKYKEQAGLEKAYLLECAAQSGEDIDIFNLDEKLLTVRKPEPKKNGGNNKKMKKDNKNKQEKKSRTQKKAEEIAEKQKQDPTYVLNNRERRVMKAYANELQRRRVHEINIEKGRIQQKTNSMNKRKHAKTNIPKTTQDTIPYLADYEEGLFEVEEGKFSKCFELTDINYMLESHDNQVSMFERWGEFLNYFSEDINISVCIDNKILTANELQQKVFYKLTGDDYDVHRVEYNDVLEKTITSDNKNIQLFKFIVVTIACDNAYEALLKFRRIQQEVIMKLRHIGSNGRVLSTEERLELLYDKFHNGKEGDFGILMQKFQEQNENFFDFISRQGLSSKDYIAPSSFIFKAKNWFCVEDRYCRCMYMNNLPTALAMDDFYNIVSDCKFQMLTNINIQPVNKEKGIKLIKDQLTSMETNILQTEQKAMEKGHMPIINHDLKQAYTKGLEMLDDCQNKNQRVFFVTIGFMVMGNSMKELEDNCEELVSKARAVTCQIKTFDYQQEEAFRIILPMGISPKKKIYVDRTLTTESTAIFTPFSSQELFQEGGFYYGLNQLSLNPILCNRKKMKTPSGFVLGSSGSGKSFAVKREMLNVLLNDSESNLLIVDPENEYSNFGKCFGGTIYNLSNNSNYHMNPMDMDEKYGLEDDDNPDTTPMVIKKEKALKKKVSYLMALFTGLYKMNPQQQAILDRAIRVTYTEFLEHDFDMKYVPTWSELQDNLEKEKEIKLSDGSLNQNAVDLADALVMYTKGSMNCFAKRTNLDFDNRFVIFNLKNVDKGPLRNASLMVVMDFIWNRTMSNSLKKIRTYAYVDEIQTIFINELAALYLLDLYKRGRKYGLIITGITQDVESVLESDIARGMITNSDFILMLNQKGDNLKELVKMLEISEIQQRAIKNAPEGSGLLFAEKVIIPFQDNFPKNSYLYTLMSTNPNEDSVDIDELIKDIQEKQRQLKLNQQMQVVG